MTIISILCCDKIMTSRGLKLLKLKLKRQFLIPNFAREKAREKARKEIKDL